MDMRDNVIGIVVSRNYKRDMRILLSLISCFPGTILFLIYICQKQYNSSLKRDSQNNQEMEYINWLLTLYGSTLVPGTMTRALWVEHEDLAAAVSNVINVYRLTRLVIDRSMHQIRSALIIDYECEIILVDNGKHTETSVVPGKQFTQRNEEENELKGSTESPMNPDPGPINHPHIITLKDLHSMSDLVELDVVEVLRDLSSQDPIRIIGELHSALAYLHTEDKTHGDVKPSNIFLDKNNSYKSYLLIYEPPDTFRGTTGYMDPNLMQLQDIKPTKRSDVYSFGIIMLQLLTGLGPGDIRKKVEKALKGVETKVLATTIGNNHEKAMELLNLALLCCNSKEDKRPDLFSKVWQPLRILLGREEGVQERESNISEIDILELRPEVVSSSVEDTKNITSALPSSLPKTKDSNPVYCHKKLYMKEVPESIFKAVPYLAEKRNDSNMEKASEWTKEKGDCIDHDQPIKNPTQIKSTPLVPVLALQEEMNTSEDIINVRDLIALFKVAFDKQASMLCELKERRCDLERQLQEVELECYRIEEEHKEAQSQILQILFPSQNKEFFIVV